MSISKHTAHRKLSLHRVNEHFEHRVTQKLARTGGFAKPSKKTNQSLMINFRLIAICYNSASHTITKQLRNSMKIPALLLSITAALTLSACSTQQVVSNTISVAKLPVKAAGVVAGKTGSVVGGTVGGMVAGRVGARIGSAVGNTAAKKATSF